MAVVSHRIPVVAVENAHPLGRHFKWDTRSDAYIYRRGVVRAAGSVLHKRNIAILDQGQLGSCTGNAMTGALGTDPIFATVSTAITLDEKYAVGIYSDAEVIDGDGPYPPQDNGSTGASVMQVALNRKLINGYQHALTVDSMAAALMTVPVIIGINWYSSFDTPSSSGVISLPKGAFVRGGHEVLVRGVDTDASMFFADNSWGASWGAAGSFQIPFAVMERLLGENGDCAVPVPLSSPAPIPTPIPSSATAADKALDEVAGPWAQKTRIRTDLSALKDAILSWEQASGL